MKEEKSGAPRGPVFVVGHSRSGTTLLAAILNAHPHMACGPETGLFDRAGGYGWRRILHDPAWPAGAVDFLTRMRRADGDAVLDDYGLTADDVRHELIGRTPSPAALMEALTVPYARARGKARWVEKTPRHLVRVARIRQAWPDAAIVRIVRDPRAVAASFAGVPFGPRTAVGAAYLWRQADAVSWRWFESDPSSLTLRYEDLVTDPQTELARLAAFLGEPLDPAMLLPGRGASELADEGPWKARVTAPIDASRIDSWRAELSPLDQDRVALICAEGMRRLGYEGALDATLECWLRPFDPASLRDAADFLAGAADHGMVLRSADRDWPRGRGRLVMWGSTGRLRWVSGGRLRSMRALLRWARRLGWARLNGQRPLWVDRPTARRPGHGPIERAGDLLTRLVARRVAPDEALRTILRG
ncbi:MAG: sulfotransferase family protein [Candidatus Limnocylindrales bacterium]